MMRNGQKCGMAQLTKHKKCGLWFGFGHIFILGGFVI